MMHVVIPPVMDKSEIPDSAEKALVIVPEIGTTTSQYKELCKFKVCVLSHGVLYIVCVII